jgi:MFS transporter, ACS family, D-galactonate transporter
MEDSFEHPPPMCWHIDRTLTATASATIGECMTDGRKIDGDLSMRAMIVMALLFSAAVINYVDRGSLSIAGHDISTEFALSKSQLGFLLSSFFITYALCQIAAGWLVDRYSVSRVFTAGFTLWSVATILSGFARSTEELFACRLLLGVGESVAFPCFAKIVSATFPAERRGVPNAVIEAGIKLGPVVGLLLGGYLITHADWRTMFVVLGSLSLIWLVPWLIWGPRVGDFAAPAPSSVADAGPSFIEILRCRDAWGTFFGAGAYTYATFFLLTWLPTYLIEVRKLSPVEMGVLGSLPLIAAAIATVIAGWASDRWIKNGASPTKARKTVVATGMLLSTIALPAATAPTVTQCIVLLVVAYVAFGVFASNHWAITQTLAGPGVGKWAGLQNSLGALTGVAAPIITGFIVQNTGSYTLAFAFTAALAVVGTASYVFLVGKVAPIDWAARRSGATS